MTKKHIFAKALAAMALCFHTISAQPADWSEGFAEFETPPATAPVVPVAVAPIAVEPVSPTSAEDLGGAGQPAMIDAESTMRLGTELSAQALATAPFMYFDRLSALGDGKLLRPQNRAAIYHPFDRITVKPTSGAVYRIGDTVDVLNVGRPISVNGRTGRLITRTGRAVVLGAAGRRMVIQLTEKWGQIEGGERIVKTAQFTPVYTDTRPAPDIPQIRGNVAARVENTATPYLQQYLIINRGSADGVMIGDFFRVRERERTNRLSEDVLEAQVVNVTENTATLIVVKLHKHHLDIGDAVFLSMRAVQ